MRNHLSWMITRKNWIRVSEAERLNGYSDVGGDDFEVVDTPVEKKETQSPDLEKTDENNGEDILKNVEKKLPENYHVAAEHKVLFGTLREEEDNSGFPIILRAHASFTALGLEYGDKRLPYKVDFQQEIHERNVDSILKSGEDKGDDTYESFCKKNDIWENPLSMILKEQIKTLKKKEYDDLILALKQEGAALPISGETKYRNDIKASLWAKWDEEEEDNARQRLLNGEKKVKDIETALRAERFKFVSSEYKKKKKSDLVNIALQEGIMTKQEIEKFDKYKKDRDGILKKIEDVYIENYGRRMFYEYPERFRQKISEYLRVFARDHVMDSDIEPVFKEKVLSHLSLTSLIEKSQAGCLEQLARDYRGFDQNAEIGGLMKELEVLACEHYVDLYPKWEMVLDRFFANFSSAKAKNRAQIAGQRIKKKDLMRGSVSHELIVAELAKLKKQIANAVFPEIDGKIKDVFVLTTGVVVMMDSGELRKSAISPLDKRMMSIIGDDKVKECWKKIWKQCQGEEDPLVCDILESKINDESTIFEDDFDKKVNSLFDMNQIQPIKVFDKETGRVHDSVQEDDYELLSELLPRFGAFVKGVELGVTDRDLNLTNLRLEIVGYLSGNDYGGGMMLVDENCRFRLREIDKLLTSTKPEKIQKAYARISAELGISLYENLSPERKEVFNGMLGSETEISEVGFFKLFHKSVSSGLERRRLIRRTLFLREFNKYLAGKSDGQMREFFEDIKKKPQLT